MSEWKRVRFYAADGDADPVSWPPPGPYWCTGYGFDESAVVVAYLPVDHDVVSLWPDARDIDTSEAPDGPQFSDRFPKPSWWDISFAHLELAVIAHEIGQPSFTAADVLKLRDEKGIGMMEAKKQLTNEWIDARMAELEQRELDYDTRLIVGILKAMRSI